MRFAKQLLKRIREVLGGHDHWEREAPKFARLPRYVDWRIYCGEGRFDTLKGNGAFHRTSKVALNFQIAGSREEIKAFEICIAWPDVNWCLMLHFDPDHCSWPRHPLYHIHFQVPDLCQGHPPFSAWRIPFGETDPTRILEYIVYQLDHGGARP